MFYLETNDGDRFFTDSNSSDRDEFGRIIESKLGRQAVQLYNDIVDENISACEDVLDNFAFDLDAVSEDFGAALNDETLDVNKLDRILSELQEIISNMRTY